MSIPADITDDQLASKLDDLARRTDAVNKAKANAQGALAAKKAQMQDLLAEIRSVGLSPDTLVASRDQLRQELITEAAKYEQDLAAAEQALSALQSAP